LVLAVLACNGFLAARAGSTVDGPTKQRPFTAAELALELAFKLTFKLTFKCKSVAPELGFAALAWA
jgi:hypothetical protein